MAVVNLDSSFFFLKRKKKECKFLRGCFGLILHALASPPTNFVSIYYYCATTAVIQQRVIKKEHQKTKKKWTGRTKNFELSEKFSYDKRNIKTDNPTELTFLRISYCNEYFFLRSVFTKKLSTEDAKIIFVIIY